LGIGNPVDPRTINSRNFWRGDDPLTRPLSSCRRGHSSVMH
jgi:hypothetical protein